MDPSANSFYQAAALHFPLTDLQNVDIFGSNVSAALGRGNVSLCYQFEGQDNWINLGAYDYDCVSYPLACSSGLSVGLWLKLDPLISPGIVLSSAGNASNAEVGITLSVTSALGLEFVGEFCCQKHGTVLNRALCSIGL